MDAAFALIKKTALVLSLALLAAMPRLAQAAAPSFTNPNSSTVITLVSGSGSVEVDGSSDSTNPPQPITFSVTVTYLNGDRPWLEVGSDTTASPSGACNGGSSTYQTA